MQHSNCNRGSVNVLKLDDVGHVKYYSLEGDSQFGAAIELISITVEPSQRRKGYGIELVNRLVKQAEAEGANCIYVKVTKTNFEFQKFLRQNGFELSPSKILFRRTL